ncbi:hypothetical protein ACIPJQ_38750 [Streptomyces griseoviridis]
MTRPFRLGEDADGSDSTWRARAPKPDTGGQLRALVVRMVREADDGIPQERRVRRTLQEMAPGYDRQPVLQMLPTEPLTPTMGACGSCNGNGGTSSTSTSGGKTVGGWTRCDVCKGTGTR